VEPETRLCGFTVLRLCGQADTPFAIQPPWHKKAPPDRPGGALWLAGLLAVGLAGPGPDERVTLAAFILEQVGEDGGVEARVIELDREVVAALAGALRPGGPDLCLMRCTA